MIYQAINLEVSNSYPQLFKTNQFKWECYYNFANTGLNDELEFLFGNMTFITQKVYYFKSFTKLIYSTSFGARLTLRLNNDVNDTRKGYLMIPTDQLSDASCMVLYGYNIEIYTMVENSLDTKYDRRAIERRMAIKNIIET